MSSLRDLLGEAQTERLMDDLGVLVTRLNKLGLGEMRPWPDFFSKFKAPKKWTRDEVEKRVTTNFFEYRTNYAMVVVAIFLLMLFSSPLLLLSLLLCVCLWVYVMVMRRGPLEVGQGVELDEAQKAMACGGTTVLILILTGQFLKLLGTVCLAAILVGLHLVFRPRTAKTKFNRLSEEMGGPSSSFFFGGGKKSAKGQLSAKEEDPEGGYEDEGASTGASSGFHRNESSARQRPSMSAVGMGSSADGRGGLAGPRPGNVSGGGAAPYKQ